MYIMHKKRFYSINNVHIERDTDNMCTATGSVNGTLVTLKYAGVAVGETDTKDAKPWLNDVRHDLVKEYARKQNLPDLPVGIRQNTDGTYQWEISVVRGGYQHGSYRNRQRFATVEEAVKDREKATFNKDSMMEVVPKYRRPATEGNGTRVDPAFLAMLKTGSRPLKVHGGVAIVGYERINLTGLDKVEACKILAEAIDRNRESEKVKAVVDKFYKDYIA